ncbi:MAG: HD domain-containing protein, partial [Lachnospiraceae bacterium]|nr:HD domain-containing protein [Lachnospiraceae bacterium]
TSGEELDLSLLYEVSDRLLYELSYIGDYNNLAKQFNIHVSVCYSNVNRTSRITVSKDICMFYRDRGLEAAKKALSFLHNETVYKSLNNDARIYLLRVARFYSALYDTFFYEYETNVKRYQALVDALELAEDKDIVNSVYDYDWTLHRVRCIEHMGQLTERGNRWGFTEGQCEKICEWLEKLKAMRERDPALISEIIPDAHYELLLLRNAYFAGRMATEEYRSSLYELYEKYSDTNYDMYSAQMNILLPLEYITTLRNEIPGPKQSNILRHLYDSVINYVLASVNLDAFNFLQEYLIGFLDEFVEIPGVMTYLDMGLECMAALHPPTYVHTLQVADIACCLAEHLAMKNPEFFYIKATDSEKTTHSKMAHILHNLYNSALCHDFGKLAMIDSIFIYGRELLDREYDIIHMHTLVGYEMLSRHLSTKECAPAALEHHLWFDGSSGYPEGYSKIPSFYASIIAVADSIDAATDNIGRSYRPGKSLDDICSELKSESGTRYAPYVIDLLNDPSVLTDLSFLLTDGRKNHYKNTFLLLNGLLGRVGVSS